MTNNKDRNQNRKQNQNSMREEFGTEFDATQVKDNNKQDKTCQNNTPVKEKRKNRF